MGTPSGDRAAFNALREVESYDYAPALLHLSRLYVLGQGIPRNDAEAFRLARRSAELGYPDGRAQFSLFLIDGIGTRRDDDGAAELMYTALVEGSGLARRLLLNQETPLQTRPAFRRAFQRHLRSGGFYSGAIDGSFGPATRAAIAAAYRSRPSSEWPLLD